MTGLTPHGSNRLDKVIWSSTLRSKYRGVVSGNMDDEAASNRLRGACRLLVRLQLSLVTHPEFDVDQGMFMASFDEEAIGSCDVKFQAFLMRLLHKAHILADVYPDLNPLLPDTLRINWQWRQEHAVLCGYSHSDAMQEIDAYIVQIAQRLNTISTDDTDVGDEQRSKPAPTRDRNSRPQRAKDVEASIGFRSDGETAEPKAKKSSARKKKKKSRRKSQADGGTIPELPAPPVMRVRVSILKDPRRRIWGIFGQPIVLEHWTTLKRKSLEVPQYTSKMGQAGWHEVDPEEIGPDKFVRDFVLRVGWVKVRWKDGVILNIAWGPYRCQTCQLRWLQTVLQSLWYLWCIWQDGFTCLLCFLKNSHCHFITDDACFVPPKVYCLPSPPVAVRVDWKDVYPWLAEGLELNERPPKGKTELVTIKRLTELQPDADVTMDHEHEERRGVKRKRQTGS
ncbi:hypothetical protein CALCODRAFT_534214 [Calocera cornea HHB12733]|uniref:Uncharacterized protein n=1 Tax=Calocera cornea HHB12733 TaxID=1353952 RepID=A0A165I397_9BASI|nr:hypothetical protein CALCODRAFT_534214 [Calocera cornea HHB12733]